MWFESTVDRRDVGKSALNVAKFGASRSAHGRGGECIVNVMHAIQAQTNWQCTVGTAQFKFDARTDRAKRDVRGREIRCLINPEGHTLAVRRSLAPIGREFIIGIDHRDPLRAQAGIDFAFRFGNSAQSPETFQMRRRGHRHDRDGGLRDRD